MFYNSFWLHRLLNANKINCLRVDAFQDLHNLNLLSLYDNKLQTIAKGTFSPLRAIQTLYVLELSICYVLQAFGFCSQIAQENFGNCRDQPQTYKNALFFLFVKGIWLRTHLFVTAIWSGWRIISIQTLLKPAVLAAPAPAVWQTKGLARSKARSFAVQVISLVQLLLLFHFQKNSHNPPSSCPPKAPMVAAGFNKKAVLFLELVSNRGNAGLRLFYHATFL